MIKSVQSWLGWPEWSVLIGQTLVIGVAYVSSTDLGFPIDLEDLLGIVAITTFLVGFSSVRLQSILEEQKDFVARKIDRVLEQNAGTDLLPLPTSLGQMGTTQDNYSEDSTTLFTILLTWFNFIVACLLIGVYQQNNDFSPIPLWLVQIVHLFIVLIGSFGPKFVTKQFKEYQKKQPFECYEQMMKEVEEFLKNEHNKGKLRTKIDDFDASVPEWSWLTLIRCSVFPEEEKDNPQLKRIYDLVEPQKDADDYSLIAFVWSAYLLDNGKYDSISRTVKYSDIEKILKFGTPKLKPKEDQDSGNSTSKEAELELAKVRLDPASTPQKIREAEIKLAQSKLQVLERFLRQPFSTPEDRASSSQIFARLTIREIVRVWCLARAQKNEN